MATTVGSSHAFARKRVIATMIALVLSILLFASLRSNDPLGTDGPFRAFEVYRRQTIFFHGGNHILYPVNVYAWTRLVQAVGFSYNDPHTFFSGLVFMNSFAGAASLALFFLITSSAMDSLWAGAIVTTILGFSRAFLGQATNAAEPMMGVFWSFLAVTAALLSIRKNSLWLASLPGVLFALAMASYQSTVLLGPAALYLVWYSQPTDGERPRGIQNVVRFLTGAVAGTAVIYGAAVYVGWLHRTPGLTLRAVVARLLEPADTHAYLGVSFAKLANIPFGLMANLFPVLRAFTGLRNLFRGPAAELLPLLLLMVATAAVLVFCFLYLARRWSGLSTEFRIVVVAGVLGLAFSSIPLVIFVPNYDKLWLQPLACLLFLVTLVLNRVAADSPKAKLCIGILAALTIVGVLGNVPSALAAHRGNCPEIEESQRLAKMVGPNDLVVGEWDPVSVLFSYTWARDGQFLSFTSAAASTGMQAVSTLQNAIAKTQAAGGQVFFLSVLDTSKTSWDSFLGVRCGVPYSTLDFYREHSIPRASFQTRSHTEVLRQFVRDDH